MAHQVRIESLASDATYSKSLLLKSSEMLKQCNFKDPENVQALQTSILGRLTSGYNETNLHDTLIFFDMHTVLNFACLDSIEQMKMLQLLVRYFKQKHQIIDIEIA